MRMYLWWSLCTLYLLYLLACQVRVINVEFVWHLSSTNSFPCVLFSKWKQITLCSIFHHPSLEPMLTYLPSAWWWRAVWKPGRQTFLPPYSELRPCSGLPSHLSFKHTQSDVTSLLLLCSVGTPSFTEWTTSWLHAHCDSHLVGTEHIFVSIRYVASIQPSGTVIMSSAAFLIHRHRKVFV